MKNQGFPDHAFDGRPIVGICNTWSELSPCNSGLRTLAEAVKRGVWEAGGFPVEFPVSSLGEAEMKPTAMLFRNLLSIDVEECIRAYGIDGVVLLGGCDKTTPGQMMGAASVDLPTIVVSAGPMLNGKWKGKRLPDPSASRPSQAPWQSAFRQGLSSSSFLPRSLRTAQGTHSFAPRSLSNRRASA